MFKNNGTKYLIIFDDSFEEIYIQKRLLEAIAGKNCGLRTIYIRQNFFHQSKHGRDVDLQNTHIVLFKAPRDVMQVKMLSVQLRFGPELVDWYQNATSVPYSHSLIDLSP